MKTFVLGLDKYGITLDELKARNPEKITYCFYFKSIDIKPLIPLEPHERSAAIAEYLKESIAFMKRRFNFHTFKPKDKKKPWGVDAISDTKTFISVTKSRRIGSVFVNRISGMKKHPKPKPKLSLYSVRARVVIQVEGQTSGLQTVEDRFVTVMARSFDDAEKRLLRDGMLSGEPYLNIDGELVRWQLEEIVDVYDVSEDELDPIGTEVYSSFSKRRMKPEYEWHPDTKNFKYET